MVFNGFQRFSIVFNGLSLHEVSTQGVMWSVIGDVFHLFYYYFIIIIIIFIFFLYSTNQLLVRLGVLGFCLLTPNSVKDMNPELCGGCHRQWCGGHHGTWEAGQRIINAWVFKP